MALSGIKLTIGIPTYNRAKYLDRSLESIKRQIGAFENKVEVLVSDNASTDNTFDIVQKYVANGLIIKYYRNDENKGPDFNIWQCYEKANGDYVIALGDDDLFLDGALEKILYIIGSGTYGLIHLNALSFTDQTDLVMKEYKKGYSIYDRPIPFLKKININVTFISGNIINKDFLSMSTMPQLMGSYLAQVDLILSALFFSTQNCYVNDQILAVQSDNSGSYNLVKVFSDNFNDIVIKFQERNGIKSIKPIIDRRLTLLFFPYYLLKLRSGSHNFDGSYNFSNLKKLYGNYIFYWIFTHPIIKLPIFLAKIYYIFIRSFRKAFVIYNNIFGNEMISKSFDRP